MAAPNAGEYLSEKWKPSEKDLELRPWKYYGYSAFAEWAASESDFFVLRRFGALNMRVILKLQDDILQLEEELESLDETNRISDDLNMNNGSFRYDPDARRVNIIERSYTKLKEYNKFLASYAPLCAQPTAGDHKVTNVSNWLNHRYRGAIHQKEAAYIDRTDDLISIVSGPNTPLRRFLQNITPMSLLRPFRVTPEWAKRSPYFDPESTVYHSDTRMENFCTFLITTVGLLMLVVPLWWLFYVENKTIQLGIITGFILLFLVMISSVTVAKPFESLAATAGYDNVTAALEELWR